MYSLSSSSMLNVFDCCFAYEWWNYHIDADGLRDYILNHGFVTAYHNPHRSLDNYYLLADDDMNDIDIETQSQIKYLHFVARYDSINNHSAIDFSDYHFTQLQTLFIGRFGFFECRNIHFTSTNWLYCFKCIDLPSLTQIIIDEIALYKVNEVGFISRKS